MVLTSDDLPVVASGPDGLEVVGASADLLRDLLRRWDEALRIAAPATWATMEPGLPQDAVVRRLGELGLVAPEEAVVWWTWRNGHREGVANGLRDAQMSMGLAIAQYGDASLGLADDQWNPAWIPVAGEGAKWSIAMQCASVEGLPFVRSVTPELGATTQGTSTDHQAVSMCTPVTLWLIAIENGWYRSNTDTGMLDYSWDGMPRDWFTSGLV